MVAESEEYIMTRPIKQHQITENYQQSQEKIVVSLLDQVGNGYTAARLQITLQHIQLIPKAKNFKSHSHNIY